ncbi:MAG: MCP four helix bundle domain-containing protein, partial [Planctomycetota bacterium]
MKLGTKIVAGFTLLVLIAVALGGLAIYNMKNVEADSNKLAKEYAPEVKWCNEVERNSQATMYDIRGYAFTEEEQYLDSGQVNLTEVQKSLDGCRELAENSPHLDGLKKAVPLTQTAVDQYKSLVEQTKALAGKLATNRTNLDTAATNYMSNCLAFLKGQNEAFKKDLQERNTKIDLVTDISGIGTRARVLNFRSQATGNPELMREAIAALQTVYQKTSVLRPITREKKDIERIDATEQAAAGYKQAMTKYLEEFLKGDNADQAVLTQQRQAMDTNAGAYVKNCEEFLADQQAALKTDMTERNRKINLISDIVNVGQETRVACFRSQALRDPEVIRQASSNFDQMTKLFGELR